VRALVTALFLSAAALASGCARPNAAAAVRQPISRERSWVSTLERDHPLVGRIWDPHANAFVDEAALTAAVAGADLVLLGETHDNADHHLIQARLVRAIGAAGKHPALAFEMIDSDLQAAVAAAQARAPRDPDAIARAVDWQHSGWYDFSLYRPVFAAGMDAGMPIVAANLPHSVAKGVAMHGDRALPDGLRTQLARYEPLPPEVVSSLRAEMRASHCDAPLPEPFLDKLSLAQRARDAEMADRMRQGATPSGAVLVTGAGHARRDRGVPMYLARDAPGKRIVSIGLFEVSASKREPAQYAAEFGSAVPFDLVVFTPGQAREDPCENLRGHDWSKKS
jgi:uncharacterized iron-regulated protein